MFDTEKLNDVDNALYKIYKKLNELYMINYPPIYDGPFEITVVNENTYIYLIDSLVKLIKRHNLLVDTLTSYNMNPFGDISVKKIYYTNKGSDLNLLINDYKKVLIELNRSLDTFNQIMELNKLTKEQ
ncbi:hypothetical protein [Weissella thailandensis]|uniref:hypothetical protein n=1 Tax=Weissella thailandensis TaxID=89061 RepID=UPI0027E49E83|nr:hypothetical protein [Weissella thailandensis]